MDFYKKIIRSKKLRFAILSALRFVPDKTMLKLQYRIKCGRKLNLNNPKRFTEKIQWYKLYYRDPVMQQCADKYLVREYVKSKGLESILNELYAVFETPDDICFEQLPDQFVLKLSNGSSTNLLVDDKNALDLNQVKQQFRDFVAQSGSSAGREWVYATENKPVIVAERYLRDPENEHRALRDYKFFCFHGEPEYVLCIDNRFTDDFSKIIYDIHWNKQQVKSGDASFAAELEKPENLEQMLQVARTLSADFPVARVDIYSIDGKIYFGEITFFPGSGYVKYTPDEFDLKLGEKFILPKRNH